MPKARSKKTISKTEFIRCQPARMPALQVVEKARDSGLSMTAQYVYKVRSVTRSKTQGKPRALAPVRRQESNESEFRRTVLQLGVKRSRALLADLERKLRRVIGK
jgi:hypothetical protein